MENNYLEHHGILGQKWGVRRFQNADGTRTAAGKARAADNLYKTRDALRAKRNRVQENKTEAIVTSFGLLNRRHHEQAKAELKALKEERDRLPDEIKKARKEHNTAIKEAIQSVDKEKLKKVAVIGGAVAATMAIAHPATRAALAKYGKTVISNLPNAATKVGTVVGKGAARFVNKTEKRAGRLGDAMVDAALASVGGIAISKLSEKMTPNENASEREKNTKKVALSAASAGIRTMTGGNGNGNNNNNSNNSNSRVDKSSAEYQNLFSGLESREDRQKIKDRANSGASMEELQRLREELGHSEVHEWIDSIISDPTRW